MCAGVGLVRHLRRRGRWIAFHRAAEFVSVLLLLLGLGQVHVFVLVPAGTTTFVMTSLLAVTTEATLVAAAPVFSTALIMAAASATAPLILAATSSSVAPAQSSAGLAWFLLLLRCLLRA